MTQPTPSIFLHPLTKPTFGSLYIGHAIWAAKITNEFLKDIGWFSKNQNIASWMTSLVLTTTMSYVLLIADENHLDSPVKTFSDKVTYIAKSVIFSGVILLPILCAARLI